DPLEIFVSRGGEIILKKYSPISELGHFATEYADALFDSLHVPAFISDRDEIIAVSGASKNDYLDKSIGSTIEGIIEDRGNVLEEEVSTVELARGTEEEVTSYTVSTVIANGDPIGAVFIIARDGEKVTEIEQRVAQTAANFLGKQME